MKRTPTKTTGLILVAVLLFTASTAFCGAVLLDKGDIQEADAESPAADYGDERGSGAVALYGRKRQMRTAVCHDVIFAGSI